MDLLSFPRERDSIGGPDIVADQRDSSKIAGAAVAAVALPPSGAAGPTAQGSGHDWQTPPSSPSFVAGGRSVGARDIAAGAVRFQYFECGNPDGAPLVLVHGFPDAPVAWQGVVGALDLSAFRIVLPYLRGYGGTVVSQPDYIGGQDAALGHDLLIFTDALKLERFHLVGHDWGARTSYAATLLDPRRIRTLTALASPYLSWGGGLYPPDQVHGNWYQFYFQVDAAKAMLTERRRDFCRELWKTWSPGWGFTEGEFATAAESWDNPQFVEIVIDYYRMRWGGALGRRAYADLQATLDAKPKPTIAVPTLFIQGAEDACDLPAGADGQEGCFTAGYERVVVPGVGHFPHRENPDAVARALLRQLHRSGGEA